MVPCRATVADLYARLSPAAARRFVADLYAARGWETAVDDGVVTVRRDGIERRVRPVPSADDAGSDSADQGSRRIGPCDAERMVRYAVGREAGRALLREHFGPDAADALAARHGFERSRWAWLRGGHATWGVDLRPIAVSLAVLLVVAGVLGAAAIQGPDGRSSPGADDPAGGTATTVDPVQAGAFESGGRPAYPPGVSPAGITSADLLVSAHQQVLTDHSYTWTLAYRIREGDETRSRYRGTVRVASADVYAVETERVGNRSGVELGVGEEVYAGGATEWYTVNGTLCSRSMTGAGAYAERAGRYVWALLRANRSLVVDRTLREGPTLYTVALHGDPWPGYRATSGSVRVDERGRIHALRRTTTRPRDNVTVEVALRFGQVGETTVSRPDWVDEMDTPPGGCYGRR